MMFRIVRTVRTIALVSASLLSASTLQAQEDTAQARKIHSDINRQLSTFNTASAILKRPDVEYQSNVRAWADPEGVRKLETIDHDDDGDVVTEYYYAKGSLVFVYQAVKGFNDAGKQATRIEHRQYFRDGVMFKWLSGTDKVPIAVSAAEFTEESKSRLRASEFFVKALNEALALKTPASAVSTK